MPIRPELRRYYGRTWRAYRIRLLSLARYRCQKCGQPHRLLNCAHVHHNPRDGQLVAVWCPKCHALNDAPHSYAVRRRTLAKRHGQLWILPEIEFAPFASWMIPRKAIAEAQGDLFREDGGKDDGSNSRTTSNTSE